MSTRIRNSQPPGKLPENYQTVSTFEFLTAKEFTKEVLMEADRLASRPDEGDSHVADNLAEAIAVVLEKWRKKSGN